MHLFSGLDQAQLGGIAQKLSEREYSAGAQIFKRGDKPDGFYMVFKGRVKITVPNADKSDRQLAMLYAGDYFGEEALFENRNRSATVTAVDACTVLFISRKGFEDLLTQYEKLKPNFQVSIKSRKLARATRFKWLGKNEVIYFIARRHKLRLYQALVGPVLSLAIPTAFFALGTLTGAVTPLVVAGLSLLAVLVWGVWNAVDWSNDYYIVTNQRVIWLEKVAFVHDSREEAPLGTILSVGVETDQLGRIFNYGNVIVRTFVGKLEFDHVDHPVQAADMIREYWERTKAITTRSQINVMKDTIKEKLGMTVEKRPQVELSPVVPVDEEKVVKTPFWLLALKNLFQLRLEEGGKVIYHKHWLILLYQAGRPVAAFIANTALIIWRLVFLARSAEASFLRLNAAGTYSPDVPTILFLVLYIPIGIWLWYEYTDWKNDIFMVSNDEIFDIDRKPLGKEERRSAQIENILSTSFKRSGFIANIFNYGTVNISVGGTQMAFEDVMDPAAVQADINRRRSARIASKNENAGKEDRERFATWIAAYHQNMNEFASNTKAATADPGTNPFNISKEDLDDLPIGDESNEGDGDQGGGFAGGGE